jgi:hypothetical protein
MSTESKIQLSRQPDDRYTSKDNDQFSALTTRCQQQSPLSTNFDDKQRRKAGHHFDYSPNDDAVFEKLMPISSRRPGSGGRASKISPHSIKSKVSSGYTHADHENFSALMSFEENRIGHIAGSCEPQNCEPTDTHDFSYTDQDQLNFEKLIPQNNHREINQKTFDSGNQDFPKNNTDRNVGTIKIIEYDKPKSGKLKLKDRPNEAIKIRYFD